MAGRQSAEVAKALRWIGRKRTWMTVDPAKCVKEAAKMFAVHETTLWRALGKQKLQGNTK